MFQEKIYLQIIDFKDTREFKYNIRKKYNG